MINVKDLEKKVVSLLKRKKVITIDDLIDKVSLYELLYVVVLKDEFTSIEIVNLDINKKQLFSDEKYKEISVPYFEIQRKEEKK